MYAVTLLQNAEDGEIGMAERGGAATQAGIFYQNTIAARYLADLIDLARLPASERVVEVRIEAPADVDDVVVRFADGHCHWLQIKTSIPPSGDAWNGLWVNLGNQFRSPDFGGEDRLLIVVADNDDVGRALREMCERASTSITTAEWQQRLTSRQTTLLSSISSAVGQDVEPIELLRRTTVEIASLSEIERSFATRRLDSAFSIPQRLLTALRDIAGDGARRRRLFRASSLRLRLASVHQIDITEPSAWGLPAYRAAVERLSRIEVPGTGIAGTAQELFVWPRACDYQRTRPSDFEDEMPVGDLHTEAATVDLREFPSENLDRCIVIAGPGYGKSALLGALAAYFGEAERPFR